MLDRDEDEARATKLIVDTQTGETVGYLYTWEDGCEQPLWLNGAHKKFALREKQKEAK